ncbi:eukaryotic-like serine/threonine-protein kinase [Anaerolineales bacterium]|nr:eukaryotic-like serine/threonine-protein kinase [Anaerolineales bacterium]
MVILARMSIPAQIGRYKIKSELGRGGMATVYLAFDPSFNRDVAIKVLPREMLHDPQFRARFEREIKMAAGLEHPAIVPVYDVGEDNGQPYFVMRLLTGGSLAEIIAQGRISFEETARIISKIAQGLTYAHKKGVVHRDLKPDNILFDENGDPFISDFGVARLAESTGSLTGSSGVIGTPAYMSPEQARGDVIDSRSDIYGLGVIVYQMLSGHQPYSADTPMGVVVKHITEPVPEILSDVPSLPAAVDQVIRLSMAKDKNKRYATAVDLAKALNLIAFGEEGNFTPASDTGIRTGVYGAAGGSSRGRTGLVVALIILVVAAVGVFLLRNQLFGAPQVEPAPIPTLTTIPTKIPTQAPTATLEPAPIPVTEAPSAIPFAPACAAGVKIPTPVIRLVDKICVDKNPYTVLSIPEGATFEPLDSKLSCRLERTSNGKSTISCGGPQLYSYNLKVCVPPVVDSADAGKCDQGLTFDSANQCCITTPPDGAGCAIFKVDLKACQ